MQISQAAICSTTLGYPALSVNPVLEGPPHTLLRDIVYAPRRVLFRGPVPESFIPWKPFIPRYLLRR
jgi:hypothetical protein